MARKQGSDLALWFTAGVALGAAVGLLYAPYSGEETRRRIRRFAEESGEELLTQGRDIFEKGKGVAEEAASYFESGRRLVDDIES
jgi:gas vesicle protein